MCIKGSPRREGGNPQYINDLSPSLGRDCLRRARFARFREKQLVTLEIRLFFYTPKTFLLITTALSVQTSLQQKHLIHLLSVRRI